MEKKYKNSYKVYSAWNYEKEIEDLNAASEQGWQLVKGGCFHSRFVKNDGVRYRYQLDFGRIDDMPRYIETFREQGWEYINSTFNNWHYLRKFYDPSLPEEEYEIFTDRESLKEMNGRWSRFALALGIILGIFSVIWLVRMILTPQMPILAQLLVYAVEMAVLLRGAAIMRKPEASKSRRGDGALLAIFFAVLVIGTASVIWLQVNRPSFGSSQMAESVDGPFENEITSFDVKYSDNYYIDLEADAKAPLTVMIVDETGKAVFSESGTAIDKSGQKLRLGRGAYRLVFSGDSGYKLNFQIE